MYLFSGILTSIVFVVLVIELVTRDRRFSKIKFKEFFYLIGWLLLSITLLYQYFNQQ